MEDGYYLVLFPGGAGEGILYFDGTGFMAHGADGYLDPGMILFVDSKPIDLGKLQNAGYLAIDQFLDEHEALQAAEAAQPVAVEQGGSGN